MTIKDLKEGITTWKLTREKIIHLAIGLTAILVYEFWARPIYRPYIYSNHINATAHYFSIAGGMISEQQINRFRSARWFYVFRL